MKNALTFIKNNDTLKTLANLDSKLNDATTDFSYGKYALITLADNHFDSIVRTDARELLDQQKLINDELAYLNSCLVFLANQWQKVSSLSTLTEEEISEQLKKVTKEIQDFVEFRQTMQSLCFRFINKNNQAEVSQLLMAA